MTSAWSYSAGDRPYTVRVAERPAKRGMVYAYWHPRGADIPVNASTGLRLRDSNGRIVEKRRAACVALAHRLSDAHAAGASSDELRGMLKTRGEARPVAAPLTLRAVLEDVYGPTFRGLTPQQAAEQARAPRPDGRAWTEHRRDDRNNADLVLACLGDRPWAMLSEAWYRELWQAYAQRLLSTSKSVSGQRQVQKLVRVLSRAVRRMHREGHRLVLPDARDLAEDIAREWPQELPAPQSIGRQRLRLRYLDWEVGAIFRTLENAAYADKIDPRLRAALMVGAERRLGQVLRCRWRDLQKAGDPNAFITVLWVPGSGRKHSGPVLLNGREHDLLVGLAKKGGSVDDPIFQGARGGMLSPGLLVPAYQELEKLAGVPHRAGRGWYGLRRSLIDLARSVDRGLSRDNPLVGSALALDMISGHVPAGMREGVYLDQANPRILRFVQEIRMVARMNAKAAYEQRISGKPPWLKKSDVQSPLGPDDF